MIRRTMAGFGVSVAALVVTGCAATGRMVDVNPGWVCDGTSCRLATDQERVQGSGFGVQARTPTLATEAQRPFLLFPNPGP